MSQPPDLADLEQLERIVELRILADRDRQRGHAITDLQAHRVPPHGDRANHDVAVGDHALGLPGREVGHDR
jgi:hypothetical protein